MLIGLVGGLLVIAGAAVAVIVGQARVNENSAETGEVPPPTYVSVAVVDGSSTDCTDVNALWEVVSSAVLFDGALLDLYDPNGVAATTNPKTLCVRNESNVQISVAAIAENVTSGEAPGCPDEFEAAANDATCDPGTGGELAGGELQIGFNARSGPGFFEPGAQGSCSTVTPVPLTEGSLTTVATLDPGGFCAFIVALFTNPDISDYSASSTDTIQFDVVLSADDGT